MYQYEWRNQGSTFYKRRDRDQFAYFFIKPMLWVLIRIASASRIGERGDSNEHPQHMFNEEHTKNTSIIIKYTS